MARLKMMRSSNVGPVKAKLPGLVDQLSSFGQPILRTGLNAQQAIVKSLGWGDGKVSTRRERTMALSYGNLVTSGEIFVRNGEYYAIALKERLEQNEVLLYCVTQGQATEVFAEFATLVGSALKLKFEPFRYNSPRFETLQREMVEAFRIPSASEVELSRVLADPNVRALAIAVRQAGGLMLSDIPKQLRSLTATEAQAMQARLTEFGLVTSEIVVLCRNVSRQVLRAPTVEALAEMAKAGGRCICGRRVDEERQERAISLTPTGSDLLDKSRWLSVLVYAELIRAGVPSDKVIVEGSLGGDEVDCVADISGELCLFELKDKDFNLGEAYSFGAKIGILSPENAAIVTTAKVGGDARQHLQRVLKADSDSYREARGLNRVKYIEGIERLGQQIAEFVSTIETSDSEVALQEILDSVTLGADLLVRALSPKAAPSSLAPRGAPGQRSARKLTTQ